MSAAVLLLCCCCAAAVRVYLHHSLICRVRATIGRIITSSLLATRGRQSAGANQPEGYQQTASTKFCWFMKKSKGGPRVLNRLIAVCEVLYLASTWVREGSGEVLVVRLGATLLCCSLLCCVLDDRRHECIEAVHWGACGGGWAGDHLIHEAA